MHDKLIQLLTGLRSFGGKRETLGLDDADILRFAARDEALPRAIEAAAANHAALRGTRADALRLPERELCRALQADYVNFYPEVTRSPYVGIAAAGPWIVTSHGAVLHDSGGYGMLGLGHAPGELLDGMARPWVMANVMSPHFNQKRLAERLRMEIGHTRGGCPFDRFICMNSGSEAVSVASRIGDIHGRRMTAPDGPKSGRRIKQLSLVESFHGRTLRAARISDSTLDIYRKQLASFRTVDWLETVPPNDIPALREAFRRAEADGVFFEAVYLEPVLGEGQPGLAITREFYDAARELADAHGSLLIVDSIQAALRAQGCLSIVDYPGFQDCAPPDGETYSKALNAGQYPLSVLALTERAADIYVPGVYGNTMTTNPRALEVGCLVLESVDETLRRNVRERGEEFLGKLTAMQREAAGAITAVTGTGLMLCAELDPERYAVVGADGFEQYLRRHGIVMIHGGTNGLRFTPHLRITSEEIDLIVDRVKQGLVELDRQVLRG